MRTDVHAVPQIMAEQAGGNVAVVAEKPAFKVTDGCAAAAIADPSPSPEPTVAESPAPAVTTEEVLGSNTSADTNADVSDGSIVDSSSNVNQANPSGETPARPQTEASTVRQNPTATRGTIRPATTPGN